MTSDKLYTRKEIIEKTSIKAHFLEIDIPEAKEYYSIIIPNILSITLAMSRLKANTFMLYILSGSSTPFAVHMVNGDEGLLLRDKLVDILIMDLKKRRENYEKH